MKNLRRVALGVGIARKGLGIRIPPLTIFLVLTLWGTVALAREISDPPPTCNASASFADRTNHPGPVGLGYGMGWDVNLSCGTTDTRVFIFQMLLTFDVWRVGEVNPREYSAGGAFGPEGPTMSYVGPVMPGLECLPPGDYTWTMRYVCEYNAPTDSEDVIDGGPLYDTFGVTGPDVSGAFSTAPADSTVTLAATVLNPPTPQGNVKISYAFGKNCGAPGIHIDSLFDDSIQVTTFTGEKMINLPVGQHVIYAMSCYAYNIIAVKVFDVPEPQSDYFVQLGVSTDPALPHTFEKRVISGGTVDVNVSLGSVFAVKLVKKRPAGGGLFTVIPLTSLYAIANKQVTPAFQTNYNLFDDGVAASVSGGVTQGFESRFVAVHLGRMDLQLLALTEPNLQPITVRLNIVRPATLGGEHNEWDSRLIEEAHERGIPPQVLKGQVRQESPNFVDTEWRYEPCSSDFAAISANQRLITHAPYSLYAMDGALGDVGLAPTVDLRNRLSIVDSTGTTRSVTHSDVGVTARALWEANPHQNWATTACGAKNTFLRTHSMAEFLDALEFIAQTPTASSYGVMQALYSTAIRYNWNVPDPSLPGRISQSPRYLRDTAESLALERGGSIFVGGTEDVERYWNHGPSSNTFPTQEDFFDSFKEPLRYYTGGGIANYGINIIDTYQYDYLPADPALVFP